MKPNPALARRKSPPITPTMRRVLRQLADGAIVINDCYGCRTEPGGWEFARVTLRGLVDRGLVVDPVPLFEPEAGRLTKHGRAWAQREWGVAADV